MSVTVAENERLRALADGDEAAILRANAGLVAAMLDCQYNTVSLDIATAEIHVEVSCRYRWSIVCLSLTHI